MPAVTLEHYAFVTAALADKLELQDVLEYLEIDPRNWNQGSVEWDERLLDDLSEGAALSLQLDQLQVRARDHWKRPIPPLDDDLRAWIDFQRGLGQKDDPLAYFESISLSPGELGGLARLWGERIEQDAELRRTAQEIMMQSPQEVEVPPLTAPKLTKSKEAAGVDGTGFFSPLGDEDLDGLPFEGAKKDKLHIAPPLDVALPEPPPDPQQDDLDGTASVEILWDSHTLPFSTKVAADEKPASEPASVPSPAPQPAAVVPAPASASPVAAAEPVSDLDATALPVAGASGAVLPFVEGDAPPPAASPEQSDEMGETGFLDAASLGLGDALPFPDAAPKSSSLDETSSMAEAANIADLPFSGEAAAPPPAELALHDEVGETGFLSAELLNLDSLPFNNSGEGADRDALLNQPLLQDMPHTLAQYAAVCIELEAAPLLRGEVMARFQLDQTSLARLTAALHELIAREPAASAAWHQARETYLTWRRQQQR